MHGSSFLRTRYSWCLLLAALACTPAAAQNYTVETFRVPAPADNDTYAQGINDGGDVVGDFQFAVGDRSFLQGFERYADGTMQNPLIDPDNPGGYFTFPTGINGSGLVCGWYLGGIGGNGFLLNQGVYQTVDEFGAANTLIQGINNNGDFVGATRPTTPPINGFISIGGTATQFNVPGATSTIVNGIADDGSAFGTAIIGGHNVGFLRGPNGSLKLFQIPKSLQYTIPTGINSTAGLIVGYYIGSSELAHGFVYRYRGKADVEPTAATASNAATPAIESIDAETVDAAQGGSTQVQGVNSSGVLVGTFQDISRSGRAGLAIGFIATPVK